VPTLQTASQFQTHIELTDPESGKSFPIEHRECNCTHKTLGSMETPSGNYSAEFIWLKTKAVDFANKIATTWLNAREENVLYFSRLTTGTMTLAEAESIHSHVTMAILPSMRYPRMFVTCLRVKAHQKERRYFTHFAWGFLSDK
jgi:hypothetical protein